MNPPRIYWGVLNQGTAMLKMVIEQRRRGLGGFEVGRILPFAKRRIVGPFVFFNHIGPVDFPLPPPQPMS